MISNKEKIKKIINTSIPKLFSFTHSNSILQLKKLYTYEKEKQVWECVQGTRNFYYAAINRSTAMTYIFFLFFLLKTRISFDFAFCSQMRTCEIFLWGYHMEITRDDGDKTLIFNIKMWKVSWIWFMETFRSNLWVLWTLKLNSQKFYFLKCCKKKKNKDANYKLSKAFKKV